MRRRRITYRYIKRRNISFIFYLKLIVLKSDIDSRVYSHSISTTLSISAPPSDAPTNANSLHMIKPSFRCTIQQMNEYMSISMRQTRVSFQDIVDSNATVLA